MGWLWYTISRVTLLLLVATCALVPVFLLTTPAQNRRIRDFLLGGFDYIRTAPPSRRSCLSAIQWFCGPIDDPDESLTLCQNAESLCQSSWFVLLHHCAFWTREGVYYAIAPFATWFIRFLHETIAG